MIIILLFLLYFVIQQYVLKNRTLLKHWEGTLTRWVGHLVGA